MLKPTSGIDVSYGVFTKTGGSSLTSDTRTIIGIFRLLLGADLIVQDICTVEVKKEKRKKNEF